MADTDAHWLLEATIGERHVTVAVRAGADQENRPLLGYLTMDLTQWQTFKDWRPGPASALTVQVKERVGG